MTMSMWPTGSLGTSVPGAWPNARLDRPRKPGMKNTNSTSTMLVTNVGTHAPISDATGA